MPIISLIGVEWQYLLIRFVSYILISKLFYSNFLDDILMSITCPYYVCLWLFKIKVPHPSYPSTLISIQVPNLGIHFSSERYFRIMELLSLLYETMENCSQPTTDNFQSKVVPWSPVDLATDGRILIWKVIPQLLLDLHTGHLR